MQFLVSHLISSTHVVCATPFSWSNAKNALQYGLNKARCALVVIYTPPPPRGISGYFRVWVYRWDSDPYPIPDHAQLHFKALF